MNKNIEEKIVRRYERLIKIIESLSDESRKEKLLKMVKEIGIRFCTAPASHRLEYHDCYPGGLFDHSVKVVKHLTSLVDLFCKDEITRDTIIITALFHDLGKIGSLEEDYYLTQDSEWHRNKLGEMYIHNLNMIYMVHSERSVWWLNHYGIDLTEDETQSILYHDGQYIERNKSIRQKETNLCLLLHWSDMSSIKFQI